MDSSSPVPDLSVVIPVCNEADAVAPLHREILEALGPTGWTHEVIFVNDGSRDATAAALAKLKDVVVVDLNRNYGQATALDAGFGEARGRIVVSMDGDGQNDPADIPRLVGKLEQDGLDVVAGWRKTRRDSIIVRALTLVGRALRHLMLGDEVHDSGCTLRAYRAAAVKTLDLGGEMHRYILAMLRWKGFRIAELEVNHRSRTTGASKYGTGKAVRGFLDLVYVWFIHKYSQRPVHFFGYLSLVCFAASLASGGWSVYEKLVQHLSFNRNGWFFISGFLFLAGLMFFSFGIVIDLLIRLHLDNSPRERRYHVRDVHRPR